MVDNNDATEENTKGLENAEKACKQTQGDADEKSKNNDDNITNDDAKESQIIEDENDDDEPAERSTYAEERFRVDRKKLEAFLQGKTFSPSKIKNLLLVTVFFFATFMASSITLNSMLTNLNHACFPYLLYLRSSLFCSVMKVYYMYQN